MTETDEVIAFLQFCYECVEEGREDKIPYDPFYKSPRAKDGILTDDYADRLISAIEDEFVHELKRYPDYHFKNADGAVIPPDFHRLSPNGRRAMAQGLDKLICKYP